MTSSGFGKILVVAWLALLSSAANAACTFATHAYRDEMANPAQIEEINVEIKKSRKWFKNSISILTSENRSIDDKFKRKFAADLTVKYPFGSCTYSAKVRQNGDWKDHIKLVSGGNVISSLDVRLNEGNVLNAVRFKLLLPETRKGANEVLGTLLLSELGYLAPETFLFSADINGVKQIMLFQENAEKELLERRNRREGPIFEGDETLLWNWEDYQKFALEDVSLARQTNAKWAQKGETSTQISLRSFKRLQLAFTEYANRVEKWGQYYGVRLTPNVKDTQPDFENYALVALAMHAGHALRPHNRKFYFNSFTQAFEPIYYDGNIDFLNRSVFFASPETLDFLLKFAAPGAILQAADRVDSLRMDPSFKQAFADRVPEGKDRADDLLNLVLEKISQRLRVYHETTIAQTTVKAQKFPDDSAAMQQQLIDRTHQHGVEVQYIHILGKSDTGAFVARRASERDETETFEIPAAGLIEIIGKNTYEGRRVTLLPNPMEAREELPRTMPFLEGEIVLSKGARIDVNHGDRAIGVAQAAPTDWVLIRGVELDGWTVAFDGALQDPAIVAGQRFNEFGLTGCLNFYDVTFKDVSISGLNGQCEDSINIVSSRGTLSELTVEAGFADAIDIDFAQISIDRLRVAGTGNDCFDVSTGRFDIRHADLANCGDKGISVGENSLLHAVHVDIQSAVIGVSSKDFSRVSIEQFTGDDVEICAEAFQKKQEFGGGALRIDAFQCAGAVNQDAASEIVLNELTQ